MMRDFAKLIIVIALAACTPQAAVLPTLIPSATIPAESPTSPPTAPPIERPTLPPEWTAAPAASETPIPTATPDAPPADIPAVPVLPTEIPGCENFTIDFDQTKRTFVPGEAVAVFWNTVNGAQFYKVMLLNDRAEEIFVDYVDADAFIFAADLFERGTLYGWQVHPINPLGVQMCLTKGAELVPEF